MYLEIFYPCNKVEFVTYFVPSAWDSWLKLLQFQEICPPEAGIKYVKTGLCDFSNVQVTTTVEYLHAQYQI